MSGDNGSYLLIPAKEALRRALDDTDTQDDGCIATTDSREEERQLSSCEDSFSMSRDEDPVQLYPRVDPSFDSSSFGGSGKERGFLREDSSPPSLPHILDDPFKREKPSLCRSMAWSQDSMDERRNVKRMRTGREEASPTTPTALNDVFSFSGYQLTREPSADSLTPIHWEEKIVDSMQLISFLDKASTYSNQA